MIISKTDRFAAWQVLLLAAVVATIALLSIESTRAGGHIAAIWPANAIVIAVLLIHHRRRWPALLAAAVLATIAANLLAGDRPLQATVLGLCNLLEIVLAAWLFDRKAGKEPLLGDSRSVTLLFLVAAAGSALSATLGTLWLAAVQASPPLATWTRWVLADFLGILVFTPPLLVALLAMPMALRQPRRLLRGTIDLLLLMAVTTLAFVQDRYPLLFIIYPPLMWLLLRHGFGMACTSLLAMSVLAIALTTLGLGPFNMIPDASIVTRVSLLQLFIFCSLILTLPVAAMLGQRERMLAIIQENERRLHELSATDALTGLANRRGHDEVLTGDCRRAAREASPLSYLLIDVDHFKAYNDRFGHVAGDACLKRIAECIKHSLYRPSDVAARYGGEELAVILPGTQQENARVVAERLRAAVEALAIPHPDTAARVVTISIGVAGAPAGKAPMPSQLITAADMALYEAKRLGRNRVMVAL